MQHRNHSIALSWIAIVIIASLSFRAETTHPVLQNGITDLTKLLGHGALSRLIGIIPSLWAIMLTVLFSAGIFFAGLYASFKPWRQESQEKRPAERAWSYWAPAYTGLFAIICDQMYGGSAGFVGDVPGFVGKLLVLSLVGITYTEGVKFRKTELAELQRLRDDPFALPPHL